MAACKLGKKRVEECLDRHGKNNFLNACEEIIKQSESSLRKEIKKNIPDGTWQFRLYRQ